jgi:hypothetical protein
MQSRRVAAIFCDISFYLRFLWNTHSFGRRGQDGGHKVLSWHELACQTYDFDKLNSLHTPDGQGIEESYPQPTMPGLAQSYQGLRDAGVRIDYHPQDAVAELRGDVAWVTITLRSIWKTDTPVGRTMLGGGEWHATFVESHVLVRTAEGWKSF